MVLCVLQAVWQQLLINVCMTVLSYRYHNPEYFDMQGYTNPGQLNCLWWYLIFVHSQYWTCFVSPFWRLEFWTGFCVFEKLVNSWRNESWPELKSQIYKLDLMTPVSSVCPYFSKHCSASFFRDRESKFEVITWLHNSRTSALFFYQDFRMSQKWSPVSTAVLP